MTVPAKPLTLPSWTWDVPDEPLRMVSDAEPDETVKSTTFTVTWTECDSDPMVPVIVTV